MSDGATGFRRVEPGGTIGILGGGQLGRMIALAAARLGYRCHVLTDETDSPAAQVVERVTLASYDDVAALDAFANAVDVVTLEFENVPERALRHLATRIAVHPGADVLAVAQDRILEKAFLNRNGVPTAPYCPVRSPADLGPAVEALGRPSVLKTARGGYDGKGQIKIAADTDLDSVVAAMTATGAGRFPCCILEGWVDFSMEMSVIVAHGRDGQTASYVPVENRHVHHILDTTIVPASIPAETAAEAERLARRAAEALDVVGLLAVEMFLTRDGRVLANEIAPRPHNSGHWTLDGCLVSQFEQLVRAICGLPLGATERHSDAVMKNLIGDEVLGWARYLTTPNARLHLYGKREIRPGRKMGHVNLLTPRPR